MPGVLQCKFIILHIISAISHHQVINKKSQKYK